MATLDIAAFTADISPDAPCGEDVEYEPALRALEAAVNGKPEAEYGKTLVASTPPDWRAALELASELLARSRDLRVAVYLTRALLARHRVEGLADGLGIVAALIERNWSALYPRLDPDDGNDPTVRVSALAMLADAPGLLKDLRDAPLAESRRFGRFCLRDVQHAAGIVPLPADTQAPSVASMAATLADSAEASVATLAALESASASAARIETALTAHVGAAYSVDLSALRTLLGQAAAFIREQLPDASDAASEAVDADADTDPDAPGARASRKRGVTGDVESRKDVVAAIERICAYYRAHEPSSPVPLLMQRARRLVDKNFIEILLDLAPEGVGQARLVSGEVEE
ncbi:hypothetical protein BTHE68_56720 [Burkholderia sp. THE68]|uniref:type VI secretion system protein TssA n=1 Tax=Burkholderia sp. THE68 TaxID=758782 RepID=UPI001319ABA4|nr:type VI secretion system protein TssA [Burkholderia sp. THE68]BBU31938.1 hypothetical protein BTHE68_56720 [Burkholderia sp. THE68]